MSEHESPNTTLPEAPSRSGRLSRRNIAVASVVVLLLVAGIFGPSWSVLLVLLTAGCASSIGTISIKDGKQDKSHMTIASGTRQASIQDKRRPQRRLRVRSLSQPMRGSLMASQSFPTIGIVPAMAAGIPATSVRKNNR